MREFSGSHRSDALYQGTTLVGPYSAPNDEALAPVFLRPGYIPPEDTKLTTTFLVGSLIVVDKAMSGNQKYTQPR
jgi:hypothetical protein